MIAITSISGILPHATSLPRRVLHTWLACYTLVLSSFCPLAHAGTHEPEPPIPDGLPADIEKVLRDYENAWKSGDAKALAALFEDDGYVLSPGNPPVHGRSAIEAAYQTAGGDLYLRGIAHEISGALAYIVGAYRMQPDGPDHGKFVLILRGTSDGTWKIVADMDNPNQ